MKHGAPEGVRAGSETDVVVDGEQCARRGIKFPKSASGVISDDGVDGTIPPQVILRFLSLLGGRLLYTQPGGWHSTADDDPVE